MPIYGAGRPNPFVAFVKTEPTLITQGVQAAIAVLVAARVIDFTDGETGSILAILTAGLALLNGLSVRPFAWPLVVGVVQAALALLLAFGFEVSQELQGSIIALTTVVGAIVIRNAVTPEAKLSPVTPQL
jgi:uncharacterized membrane protein YphA (DoxX/SURF4 family)